jgi:16S rRNA (guanine527-N7)-methyltransferase
VGLSPAAQKALETLCERFGLAAVQQQQLSAVLVALAADDHAPSTVRDPERAVEIHLADSLVALELELAPSARTIADLGAGAGFPGLPLAVALAESEVRLVESQGRRCAFIERVCQLAGIENVRVVHARGEEWQEGLGDHDVVLARALAPAPVVLEYAAPLLRMGGMLVDWRGRRNAQEERAALSAADELGMGPPEIRRVEPFPGARDHHLHVYSKAQETPARFPRRAGMARKRPLGS